MTTPLARRSPVAVGGFALLGTVLFAAACNTDVPTAAEVRDADVAAVTKTLGLPSAPGAVTYLVDGVRMSELESRAIPAVEIASIEVRRASGGVGENEVRILTRKAAARGDWVEVPVEGATELKKVPYTVLELADGSRRGSRSQEQRFPVLRSIGDSLVVDWGDSVVVMGRKPDDVAFERPARVMLRKDGTAGDTVRELAAPRAYMLEERASEGQVIVRGTQSASAAQPLIIIDGVIATVPNALQNIKPDQIDRIEVIKGDAAKRLYGTRGADGVIKVTTKP